MKNNLLKNLTSRFRDFFGVKNKGQIGTKKDMPQSEGNVGSGTEKIPMGVSEIKEPKQNFLDIRCPYCGSEKNVKRGMRQKKLEKVQLYLCRECKKTFTPGSVKGKHYPISVVIEAISLYNLGFSLEQAAKLAGEISVKNGTGFSEMKISSATLLNWLEQYKDLCAYSRMRPFAVKMFKPKEIISSATLAHRQLYRFRHHRAKTEMIIREDIKHYRFRPLQEFLNLVPAECPHQYFQDGLRASEAPMAFNKTEMIVRGKNNYANKIAKFALESANAAKDRHDTLQRFMLANDSVTVATEVPVYIRREDLAHMQTQLGFQMYKKRSKKEKDEKKEMELFSADDLPKLITGHIDMVQIRNGFIHLLDYKPNAAKERPIEQLTLYALALSRLTGLRVFNFKCAWFDEKDYFEFFPLHVVYKPRRKRRKNKIRTIEGLYALNNNPERVEKIRPATEIYPLSKTKERIAVAK